MESNGATVSFGRSQEERGAGGKLRRPSARKPPSTPYARPPSVQAQGGHRRWLSKLVDPAYRLIADGATRILPSFFSKSAPPSASLALPAPTDEDRGKLDPEGEQDGSDNDDCTIIHGVSRNAEAAGPSRVADGTNSGFGFERDKQDEKRELSENGLSEIEQLMRGKSFSRDEIDRLMEIIHSRAVDLPDGEKGKKYETEIAGGKAERPMVALEMPIKSVEEKHEDLNKAIWATSTPLPKSTMRDEVGASPIDIARAYMGSRTLEIGIGSKSIVSTDERPLLLSDDFVSKPSFPSPSPKPAICWPGATVQDQSASFTPQSQRRIGLHNFPQTPYSRTIFSKSKSKTQLQDNSNKSLNISSTPFQYSRTPMFEQSKPRSAAIDDGYGSVGPIRRIRHKVVEKPLAGSSYLRTPLSRPSQVGNTVNSKGFLPLVKKSLEPGETSGAKQFQSLDNKPLSLEVGVSTAPRQTSQVARLMSEHIDRNTVTPKDKYEELKRATAWKKSQSSDDAAKPDDRNTSPSFVGLAFHKSISQIHQNSDQQNVNSGNCFSRVPLRESSIEATDAVKSNTSASDKKVIGYSSNDGPALVSQVQSMPEDVSKMIPNAAGKSRTQSPGSKPNLASISIDKPQQKWAVSSDLGAGFTFPVSTTSGAASEPPTPTIIPAFSGSGSPQAKEGATADPSFDFGSKRTSPRLVFSFPSTSSAAIPDGSVDLKFNFGSDKKRISFGSIKKDAICY